MLEKVRGAFANVVPKLAEQQQGILLGEGAFGKVYKETMSVAVKRIENFNKDAVKEVDTLKKLNQYFPKEYFPKMYFPEGCFPKLYFTKVFFPKAYFTKVYFRKGYFPKVYFSNVYFPKVYCKYASILGPNFFD